MMLTKILSKLSDLIKNKPVYFVVLLMLIGAAILFWSRPAPVAKTIVTTKSVETKATVKVAEKSAVKSVEKTTASSTANKNVKAVVRKVITDFDPSTGKVVRTSEETSDTSTTEGAISNVSQSVEATQDVTVDTQSATQVVEQLKEAVSIVPVDTKPPESSRIGVAVNMNARPMLTYDVVKVGRFSLDATAEIRPNPFAVTAAGLAVLANTGKSDRYFIGAYGQYSFEKKAVEKGICAGMRF